MRNSLLAFVFVKVDPHPSSADVSKLLARIPEAIEVHRVAGDDSYLVKVRVGNSEQLGKLLTSKFEAIESVSSARTTVVLKTVKTCQQQPTRKIAAPARG